MTSMRFCQRLFAHIARYDSRKLSIAFKDLQLRNAYMVTPCRHSSSSSSFSEVTDPSRIRDFAIIGKASANIL